MNVLFIGNSHTYLHFMPQMLVELAHTAGKGIKAEYRPDYRRGRRSAMALEQCANSGEDPKPTVGLGSVAGSQRRSP